MPLPDQFTAAHLQAGVVPSVAAATEDDHRLAVAAALDASRLRLDVRADLLDAWRDRLPRLPAPERTSTLQEAVQAARVRLRTERAGADRVELDNRVAVVGHLRDGLR